MKRNIILPFQVTKIVIEILEEKYDKYLKRKCNKYLKRNIILPFQVTKIVFERVFCETASGERRESGGFLHQFLIYFLFKLRKKSFDISTSVSIFFFNLWKIIQHKKWKGGKEICCWFFFLFNVLKTRKVWNKSCWSDMYERIHPYPVSLSAWDSVSLTLHNAKVEKRG